MQVIGVKTRLEEKIRALEQEKSILQEEVKQLREAVELSEKAKTLESEVSSLKSEAKSLRRRIPQEFSLEPNEIASAVLDGEEGTPQDEECSGCEEEELL